MFQLQGLVCVTTLHGAGKKLCSKCRHCTYMNLACWRLGWLKMPSSDLFPKWGGKMQEKRWSMEEGLGEKCNKKTRWGCLFDQGEAPLFYPSLPPDAKSPPKTFHLLFFRLILICGQNSEQTLFRYQSPPRFKSGQDYQPDMCSAVWRFEFNWSRWASDWPKIRCTSCVKRIFWRGKIL